MEQSGRCHLDQGVILVALDPLLHDGTDERTDGSQMLLARMPSLSAGNFRWPAGAINPAGRSGYSAAEDAPDCPGTA